MPTNESRCLLSGRCKIAGTDACTSQCSSFIALHGRNGLGGRVGAANVPKDYRLVTLANSPARESQAKRYDFLIEQYVPTFERQFEPEGGRTQPEAQRRIKSLYLWSESPGTGKTTTAAALLNEWLIRHYIGSIKRGRQPLQQPAYFLDIPGWQELYNGFARKGVPQDIAEQNSRQYYRNMEIAKKVPFLVMDDLGVRDATEAFRSDLHTIINYRTVNSLPTIYTSNLPLDSGVPDSQRVGAYKPYDIKDVYDPRLFDRVRDQCLSLAFSGTSKRGRR